MSLTNNGMHRCRLVSFLGSSKIVMSNRIKQKLFRVSSNLEQNPSATALQARAPAPGICCSSQAASSVSVWAASLYASPSRSERAS
jgi:hypothetical protein